MRRVVKSSASSLSTRKLFGSTLFWIGFGIFGWYFPRSIIHADTSIVELQPPYQISGGDTVILDFELNQPLVDPPTVDSEFLLRIRIAWLPPIVISKDLCCYKNSNLQRSAHQLTLFVRFIAPKHINMDTPYLFRTSFVVHELTNFEHQFRS